MQVTLAVHGLTFPVACGEGMQSIKWLGLVAAQRYALMLPHGRCRTREDAHSKNGFYLPSEVRNSEGGLLSPWSRIVECVRENETITIVLQHEVPVDDIGVPQLSSWAVSAFSNANNQHVDHDKSTAADEKNDVESFSKGDNRSSVYSNIQGYSSSFHASHLKSGQFISQDELESAFYHDVAQLEIDEFLKDPKDKEDAEDVLLKYYDSLVAIFKHYGLGYGEDSFAMSGAEFSHFVHETALLHYVKDASLLDKLFVQALPDNEKVALSRVGFIQALVSTIVTYNKMYGDDLAFLPALEKALKDAVKPACTRLTTGPFRDNLHSDGMLSMLQEAKPKLAKVYDKYASGKQNNVEGPILSVSDFRSLVQDSGIFCTGDSDKHEALFNQAINQCFTGMSEIKDGEKQFVVFVEFIEVICRLSLAIWADKDVSAKETIRIGLDAVRALSKTVK
ncbi:hypothetical protein H310_14017 [Aphanomyces invadans]|uniref:Uncharacterized protein n=1 Tax=Aphanomyces invadans TaxID=157072 RepID=A0A024TBT7_9STRA|nr:hypothetical protein H310_14017 [Aphanomyces invadans]ETV91498.1 hypothetical protein H310_14017 [Aphanomyces invadans]|eukprot:XP_008879950.1 hypothetical protein H310_14017 [Aphanomyces invadans]